MRRKVQDSKVYRTPVGSPAKLSMRLRFCSNANVSVPAFLGGVGGGFARTEEGMKAIAVVDLCTEEGELEGGGFMLPLALPLL